MKIQYASDLHLEFPENKAFLKENPLKPVGDILILAGDILLFTQLDNHQDFFDYLSDHFQDTYWVPGNHEYYHSDLANRSGIFHEKIRSNVHLLNNKSIKIDEVEFFFTTLWSHISDKNQWYVSRRMNDFRLINFQSEYFSTHIYNQLHTQSLEFLQTAFAISKSSKKVVASHHIPTFHNYPEKYKDDSLNEAFAVELFDTIEKYQPDLWIFGHSHANVSDFSIGKTQLRTNQMGYCQFDEHTQFSCEKTFKF